MAVLTIFLIISAVGAVEGLASWWFKPRTVARRLLRRVSNVAIGRVVDGQRAKITGKVGSPQPLMRSPIGERLCVGFQLSIDEILDDGATQVLRQEVCGPFAIADDTGTVHIEGQVMIGLDVDGDWADLTPGGFELLEQAGVATGNGTSWRRRFRYRETLLGPGDLISALGRVSVEVNPSAGALGDRASHEIVRMRGSRAHPIVIADADRGTGG